MSGPKDFAERLRTTRRHAGLTQQQLADKIHYQKCSVQSWEQNRRKPSWEALVLLARALGVDVKFLMTGEDD